MKEQRYVLKILRGDFENMAAQEPSPPIRNALDLVQRVRS
jgi:hypothetical protein